MGTGSIVLLATTAQNLLLELLQEIQKLISRVLFSFLARSRMDPELNSSQNTSGEPRTSGPSFSIQGTLMGMECQNDRSAVLLYHRTPTGLLVLTSELN